MIDALIKELETETASTRKVLAVVPEKELNWKPHEKSMSLGKLAGHLADIQAWTQSTFATDALDVAGHKNEDYTTVARLLEVFDKNVKEGLATLKKAKPEDLSKPWSLQYQGQNLFTISKLDVMRIWVFNHSYHHRGQLTVYLRLKNVPLPNVYGPTADNPGM